ncbi:MAG: aldose 1-epimerase family protein, partial [Microcella pacifica]
MTATLFGAPLDDAIRLMGSIEQAVSITSSTLAGGPSSMSRRIHVINGDLDFEVLPDRALDLGQLRVAGMPVAWISPTGFPRLVAAGVDAQSWLRAFGGGLLTTCGLLNVGPASHDGEQSHPMHGRISSLPAEVTRTEVVDEEIVIEGIVREAAVFGENLELHRRITSRVGGRTVRVADRLVNRGSRPVEPMVLYHLNFGWPLVDEGTELRSPATEVRPRDDDAAVGATSWATFPAPQDRYPEQVFQHLLPADQTIDVEVVSPRGLTVGVRFDSAQLPGLFQWRVAEPGHYVLGVEPSLVPTILGRTAAREQNLLVPLEPGGHLNLGVEVTLST